MKKQIIFACVALGMIACSGSKTVETSENQTTEKASKGSGATSISFSEEQMKHMTIQTGHLEERELAKIITANGFLELPPDNMITLSLPIDMKVKRVYVQQGQEVVAGQQLIDLEHPEFITLQKEYLENKSDFELTQSEYNRLKTLSKDNVTSEKQLQEALAKFNSAKASYQASVASLDMLKVNPSEVETNGITSTLSVKSPIAGYVTNDFVNVGKMMSAGAELYEIINKKHVHINLDIFEKDLQLLTIGEKVIFNLVSNPTQKYEAKVEYIGERVDRESRSVKVIAHIPEISEEFKPGMYVNSSIYTKVKSVMTLPQTAIAKHDDEWYAFIQKGNAFTGVKVEKGDEMEESVEILNPQSFPADAAIVTRGAYYIQTEIEKLSE